MPTWEPCPRCEGGQRVPQEACWRCERRGVVPVLTAAEVQEWAAVPVSSRVRWCLVRHAVPAAAVPAMSDEELLNLRNLGVGALAQLRALFPFVPGRPLPAPPVRFEDAAWTVIA